MPRRAAQAFNTSVVLCPGDVLDFQVDYGANGNYTGDATRLDVRLAAPAPRHTGSADAARPSPPRPSEDHMFVRGRHDVLVAVGALVIGACGGAAPGGDGTAVAGETRPTSAARAEGREAQARQLCADVARRSGGRVNDGSNVDSTRINAPGEWTVQPVADKPEDFTVHGKRTWYWQGKGEVYDWTCTVNLTYKVVRAE